MLSQGASKDWNEPLRSTMHEDPHGRVLHLTQFWANVPVCTRQSVRSTGNRKERDRQSYVKEEKMLL